MFTGHLVIDIFATIGYLIIPAIGGLLLIGDPTERFAE